MSKFWESRLWETSTLKGTLLLAALAIADNADDSGVAWPGYTLIAKKTRMSLRQVPRIIVSLEASKEIAVRWGGSKRGDVNTYVFLIGRDLEEVGMIQKIIARKGDKMALLKACQNVMLKNMPDKISLKKDPQKHDMGIRETSLEPLNMDGKSMDEWLNDPICGFLLMLPGYNPKDIETDRAAIVARNYSLEALRYLWEDCAAEGDNPIGLFLYRIGQGMHSPRFLDLIDERKRQSAYEAQPRIQQAEPPVRLEPDATVTDKHLQLWQSMMGEIEMDVRKETFTRLIRPARPISINCAWTIAIPADSQTWWNRLDSTLKRIYHGYTDKQTDFVYVEEAR